MGDANIENEIQWVKHGSSVVTHIFGKDTIVLSNKSYISFIETSRPEKKDLIYHANSEGRGDGVQCLCMHKSLPCFAFAEKSRNPRILIVSYPSFEILRKLESVTDSVVLDIGFSEMEYIIALTGLPDFKIIVWNFRSLDRVFMQETKYRFQHQWIQASIITPLQILQCSTESREICFWNMSFCYKRIVFYKTSQFLPENTYPPYSFCYAGDLELYFTDTSGALYQINTDNYTATSLIEGCGAPVPHHRPSIVWYKGGLVISAPNEVQFWKKKSPEGWGLVWVHIPKTPLVKLFSSFLKENLFGLTEWNEIMIFKGETQIDCVHLRSYGSDFEFIGFVNPVGDYFMTFGNYKKCFTIWNKVNGQKISQLTWAKSRVNAMEANPKKPYMVVVTEDGRANIINAFDPNYLMELDEVALTRNSLNGVRFSSLGSQICVANKDIGEFFYLKLPAKIDVAAHLKIDLKIVDYAVTEMEENKVLLLVVPMSQLCCRSGHNLMVFHLVEKQKHFDFVKDLTMPWVVTSFVPSLLSSKEIFCTIHRSRQVCAMNMQTGKVTYKLLSGHQIKLFSIHCDKDCLYTYGYDGIVIVNAIPAKKCLTVFSSHHRMSKGIKRLIVDPYTKYIITLGNDGSMVCTVLKKIGKMDMKSENEATMASAHFKQLFFSPIASEKAKAKALEKLLQQHPEQAKEALGEMIQKPKVWDKVWLEVRRDETINNEEVANRKERQSILEELESLQNKVKQLLNENNANVPEKQLPVQAFDLDKATRRKKLEDGKTDREKEKQLQLATIKNLNKITDIIKKVCWDSIAVKGQQIRAILAPTAIDSYALLPESISPRNSMNFIEERLNLETYFRMGDFFEPWVPRDEGSLESHISRKFKVSNIDVTERIRTKFKEEHLDEDGVRILLEEEKQKLIWTGTSTHNFIQVNPHHYNQFELLTFFQAHQEVQLIQSDVKKLMVWFNKEFQESYNAKEQEMGFVYQRNNLLRHIISELNFFHFSPEICRTQIYDPEWAAEEKPETIMKVEDWEITSPKYISESETELLKIKVSEEEKLKHLLNEDDFKEKALIQMMDGVLEKLWEDEIKKDAVKPKCMIEKEPDSWTEEDLKAIKAYEESVKILLIERERYKKILEEKWGKTVANIRDSVTKFDDKMLKFHFLKLKVQSAIRQETLKGLRIRLRCFQRIAMDRKEEKLKSKIIKNERKIEVLNADLAKFNETLQDYRNYYEGLQLKDKNMDKNFKKEFPEYSPIVTEQLYKISKKRPKLMPKAAVYVSVVNEMGKCIATGGKPEFLTPESAQYIKDIDALDSPSNAPASIPPQTWDMVCKMRRQKIDTELKMKACTIDLNKAEMGMISCHKALKMAKERHIQLINDLQAVRMEKLNSSINNQIQLVMKKGLVEVPLTGHISDFDECLLVTKDTLNEVNKSIHKMGLQKIKAMEKAANFRKGIIYKEWEHKKLRMEIEDLKSQLDTVRNFQVLKELQAILTARARGFSDEKGFIYVENEITKVKDKFHKIEIDLLKKIDDFDMEIQKINHKNRDLNQKIEELNIEVNEIDLERIKDFDEKAFMTNQKKMKKIRERSRLVRLIKEQYNEIVMLQTELELLRLKTYPTIKHKTP